MKKAEDQVDLVMHLNDLHKIGLDSGSFYRAGRNEWHGPCPFCGGHDRFLVSNGMVYCRRCNYGGTYVQLADKLGKPLDKSKWKAQAAEYEKMRAAEEYKKAQERVNKIKALNQPVDGYRNLGHKLHVNLINSPVELLSLESQGLEKQAIRKFQVGLIDEFRYFHKGTHYTTSAFTFPIYKPGDDSKLMNIRVRLRFPEPGAGKYRPWDYGLGAGFFDASFPGCRWVVITEGEKKAMILWQNGIPAIGLWGVEVFKDEWIPWFKRNFDEKYIVYDREENAGVIQAQGKIAKKIDGHVVTLPYPGKPDDLLVENTMTVEELMKALYDSQKKGDYE